MCACFRHKGTYVSSRGSAPLLPMGPGDMGELWSRRECMGTHGPAVQCQHLQGTAVTLAVQGGVGWHWGFVSPAQETLVCFMSSATQQSCSGEAAVLRSTSASALGAFLISGLHL